MLHNRDVMVRTSLPPAAETAGGTDERGEEDVLDSDALTSRSQAQSQAQSHAQRGCLRLDRCFAVIGVDRLQRSSGTKDPVEFGWLNDLLTTLASSPEGALIVRAFAVGQLTLEQLKVATTPAAVTMVAATAVQVLPSAADKSASSSHPTQPRPVIVTAVNLRPEEILASILGPRPSDQEQIAKPLWSTAHELIAKRKNDDSTKRRYGTSVRMLEQKLCTFRLSEDVYEVLAGISEAEWHALDSLRRRGISIGDLRAMLPLPSIVRAQRLRKLRVRIGADYIGRIDRLTRLEWDTLEAVGERPVHARVFELLDKITDAQRVRLREIATLVDSEATFATLVRLTEQDWKLVANSWAGSGSDWNNVRRAFSAVLTQLFGDDARHVIRCHIIDRMPLRPENQRVPDVSPALLWRILGQLPLEARNFPICLAATGLRVGEYEALEAEHLSAETCTIAVPGTKTLGSHDTIQVAPDLWEYIQRGVPSPFRYSWMRRLWREACATVGAHGVTLHDLRHCHAQWALENGAHEHEVQAQLRHASSETTRRYVRTKSKSRAAQAASAAIMSGRPDSSV